MRIVHMIDSMDPACGGPQSVIIRLAAAQAEQEHEVSIVSWRRDGMEERIAASLRGIPGVHRVRLACLPRQPQWKLWGGSDDLCHCVGEAGVVHLHGVWEAGLLNAARLARERSVPYVLTPHGMLYPWSLSRKWLKKKLALWLGFRRMLNGAAFLQALNADESRALAAQSLRSRVRVFPNGIFESEVQSSDDLPGLEESYPPLRGRPYVLFLSRLHPGKGLTLLAEAFARVAAEQGTVQLVVAGPDAGARPEFERRVGELGLADRVHLVGPLYGAAKLAALRGAACFCLPSEHETFSVAITEAMACRAPVVITEECHFPEVAAAGAGEIVRRRAEDIAAALLRILGDPVRRDRMGEAGRDLVFARFTWPRIAREMIAAYQEGNHA